MQDFRELVDDVLTVCTDTFGEEVTFFPLNRTGVYKARGIFDNEYAVVDTDTEEVISSNQPALGINLNDIKFDIKQNDQVEIRDQRFSIYDKREDGQGGAVLLLHRINAKKKTTDTRVR